MLRHAEDVCVVLLEAADAGEAVEGAGKLIPVEDAEIGEAHGEFAVGALAGAEHEAVRRAVHRLDEIFHTVDVHCGIHAVAVEVEVTRGFPKIRFTDVRRIDDVVAVPEMFSLPEILVPPPPLRRVHFDISTVDRLDEKGSALDSLLSAHASGQVSSDGSDDSTASIAYLMEYCCGVQDGLMEV